MLVRDIYYAMAAGEKNKIQGERNPEENYIKNGGKGLKNSSFFGYKLQKCSRGKKYLKLIYFCI